MNIKETIYSMLIQNTGSHFLDSGGAYGRNHERNAKKTLEDFENEPAAWIDCKYGFDLSISLFHHLTNTLSINDLCKEFNKMPCSDFDGDYYGVDKDQSEWLACAGFVEDKNRSSFNSYNWGTNLTQVVQGTFLDFDGDSYVLLQIHGGCDVRGGYTDAKLFLVDSDYFMYESASFDLPDGKHFDFTGGDYELYDPENGSSKYIDYFDADNMLKSFGDIVLHGEVYY